MSSPLLVEFLGVVLRWLISSIGAYLVAKHVLTTDQEAKFADGAIAYVMAHLAIWAPMVVGLAWGLWAKYRSRLKFIAALELPAGSSEQQANEQAKTSTVKAQAFSAGAVLLAFALAGAAMSACADVTASQPPTKVAAVADVGSRIQDSANALLHQAQTAASTKLITDQQLVVVALVVDKIGRLGLDLRRGLDDYNAVKSAGGNTQVAAAALQTTISDITKALADVGKQIPNGTVAAIDQAVTTIFGILEQVKVGGL